MRFLTVIFLTCLSFVSYADALTSIPNTFDIQQYTCTGKCFEVKDAITKARLGRLMPLEQRKTTFIFKDVQDEPQFLIQYIYHYYNETYFNVYDQQGRFLNRITLLDPFLASSMDLVVYDLDATTPKMRFFNNFIGTYHKVFKGVNAYTGTTLATFTRPYFSRKTDSRVTIVQPEQLYTLIKPELFMALSSVYSLNLGTLERDPSVKRIQDRIYKLKKTYPIKHAVSLQELNSISELFNQRFQEQYQDVILPPEEKIEKFVDFCCDLIDSHALTADEEKAATQFMIKNFY